MNGTYHHTVDWSSIAGLTDIDSIMQGASGLLEDESFSSETDYDALNRPVTMTTPDNSVTRPRYNEANLLEEIDVKLQGSDTPTPIVTNIDYDAKGQRERIDYGNGVSTLYDYDPLTFRLAHLLTRRNVADFPDDCPQSPPEEWPGCQVQNLHYTYDPAGNITHIQDDAQQTIFFRNQRVDPSNDYTYDALYRLIEATGREHLGQIGTPLPHSYNDGQRVGLLHPGDGQAMATYTERYVYDAVGNFLKMQHHGSDPDHPGWTRSYDYAETSLIDNGEGETLLKTNNRLSSTTVGNGGQVTEEYAYDAHGNMTRMPQLQDMEWDYNDQLSMTQRQKINDEDVDGIEHHGERTYCTYDAAGQRVRKITVLSNGKLKDERIYLGGFEIYRRHSGEDAGLVRESLHIMDDERRVALVETRNDVDDETPKQLIRYQFGNHLGSASLELDGNAQIISYEEYTPYGSTSYQALNKDIKAAAKRYRYTGKERDEESGLYYYGARYYAGWLGSWTAPDPEGLVDGTNLYWYARANPITYLDYDGERAATPQEKAILSMLSKFETYHLKRFRDMSKAAQAWDFFVSGSGAVRQSAILHSHRIGLTDAIERAKEGEAVLPVAETPATIDITGDKDRKLFELTRYTNYLTESEGQLMQALRVGDAIRSNPLSGLAYVAGGLAGASEETKGNLALTGEALWNVASASPGVVSGIKQNRGLSAMRRGMRLQTRLEKQLFAGKHPLKMRDTNISVGIARDRSGKPTILVSVNKGASKAVIQQLREQAKKEGWSFIEPTVGHAEINLQAKASYSSIDILSSNYNCPKCTSLASKNVRLHDTKYYEGFRASGNPDTQVPASSKPLPDMVKRPAEPLNQIYGYGN